MSESRWRAVAAAVATVAVAGWLAGTQVVAQTPGARGVPAAPRTPAPPPAVATVGPMSVTELEFEQRASQAMAEYRARTNSVIPEEIVPVVRRQLLESLIRRDLLMLEARRRGMLATEQAAEEQLKKDPFFQVAGKFDPGRFNQVKTQNPAAFANAIQELRASLGARDLMDRLQVEKGPAEAPLRARAVRALTRADLEYLVLRRGEFDGSYPEPRESEVLAYYRAHTGEFFRPQRAVLSVVFVDQPALSDSERTVPATVAAWNDRMKVRADSILAAVKAGAKLEEASAPLGGPRPNQVVLPDNFPGYWKGSPQQRAAVFAAQPGTILPEAVPAPSGWLVVRVDENRPAHTAELREVAREIRNRMRSERRQHHEEAELRALYETQRDSLRTTAYRLRYAIADTGTIDPGRPAAGELERWYRAHLADYTAFDNKAGGVVEKPFAEVQDEVRGRWARERRLQVARETAEQLGAAWDRGRRDAALERRLGVRELGPALPGTPADTGDVGRALADTLSNRRGALGTGLVRAGRGWLVFDIYQAVPDFVPSFDQARTRLAALRTRQRLQEDEAGARRLFDASPADFSAGNRVCYSRVIVPTPPLLTVPLTYEEVARYHREHIDKYSAPELVTASHILISPRDNSPAADREARARADSILARLRAGDDFAEAAKRASDDPATKDEGGDLGTFGRGSMLPEFEKAAFELRAGDLCREPVRTQVGYHIIKVRKYDPLVAEPLAQVYANVSGDAATEKADSLARRRADSLYRAFKTPEQARRECKRVGLQYYTYQHVIGDREVSNPEGQVYFQRLDTLKPGQFYPGTQFFKGQGWTVTWVDSIIPPRTPTWEEAKPRALEAFRRGAGQRALDAKRAELDSLMQAGWSFDSVAVLWGGLERRADLTPGASLPGVGSPGRVDTLVFGAKGTDGLAVGRLSDWVLLPGGALRLRVEAVRPPDATAGTTRVQNERRTETERALMTYFDDLRKRYRVRILDKKLRDVMLPQPPPER